MTRTDAIVTLAAAVQCTHPTTADPRAVAWHAIRLLEELDAAGWESGRPLQFDPEEIPPPRCGPVEAGPR